jgi:hypothetical protein
LNGVKWRSAIFGGRSGLEESSDENQHHFLAQSFHSNDGSVWSRFVTGKPARGERFERISLFDPRRELRISKDFTLNDIRIVQSEPETKNSGREIVSKMPSKWKESGEGLRHLEFRIGLTIEHKAIALGIDQIERSVVSVQSAPAVESRGSTRPVE